MNLRSLLDLSNFDTSEVTNVERMFECSQIKRGYARSQDDMNKLNSSYHKTEGLIFEIKQ